MSSPYVQHALQGAHHQRESLAARVGWIVLGVGAMCLAMGVAIARDAAAEARDQVHQERVMAQLERLRTDQLWTRSMARAYARGRDDALQAEANSPEAIDLAQACALFPGHQP